jgi:hypothetical protein
MRDCSTGKWSGQEWRTIGDGCVYVGHSQESSRWAKIQNLDKVWGGGQSDNVQLGLSVNWGLSQVGPNKVRQGQTLSDCRFLFVDGFEKTWNRLTRLFSLHPTAPLNSTVFLYSRNIIKTSCSTT